MANPPADAPAGVPARVPHRGSSPRLTALICAGLIVIHVALAFVAARSKSPTYDEPLHALSAYLQRYDGDFRIDPEDPPLWKYWVALPLGRGAIDVPTDAQNYKDAAEDLQYEWPFTVDTLYRTGDNAAKSDDFIMRSRAMMLVLSVVLAGVIAWWSWQLSGPAAAIAATTLYCFCPNFLAHAPLVKNDVPLTLVTASLFFAVWRAGRKLTVWNLLAIALLCAAAVTVKFSGLLLGPIVVVLLMVRAFDHRPWETFWRTLGLRTDKLVMSLLVLALCAVVSYGGIWASYQFRFSPSRDPSVRLNMHQMTLYAAAAELHLRYGRAPSEEEVKQAQLGTTGKIILKLEENRLLPQAWLNGLLYTYQSALWRMTFLLGAHSTTGWWYYFPVAIATKTPLATLAAMALAVAMLIVVARQLGWKSLLNWTSVCLFVPPAIFLAMAMHSNLNLGLRHVLPIYPFLFVGVALGATEARRRWPPRAKWVARSIALVLVIEVSSVFPDYIPFFNVAAGGSRGGLRILGDSNLDWGQDLKLVRQWQLKHPDVNLYFIYFGLADPWAYGIEYTNFPGGYPFGEKYKVTSEPGVLAVSATHLQGVYAPETEMREIFASIRSMKPIEVLGGSIYLYRWPPPKLK